MKRILTVSTEECYKFVRDYSNTGYVMIIIDNDKDSRSVIQFNRTERCPDYFWERFDENVINHGFSNFDADRMVEFIKKYKDTETLVITAPNGILRSNAIKHAIIKCLGLPEEEVTAEMNNFVYEQIVKAWERSEKPPAPLKPKMIDGKLVFVEDDTE